MSLCLKPGVPVGAARRRGPALFSYRSGTSCSPPVAAATGRSSAPRAFSTSSVAQCVYPPGCHCPTSQAPHSSCGSDAAGHRPQGDRAGGHRNPAVTKDRSAMRTSAGGARAPLRAEAHPTTWQTPSRGRWVRSAKISALASAGARTLGSVRGSRANGTVRDRQPVAAGRQTPRHWVRSDGGRRWRSDKRRRRPPTKAGERSWQPDIADPRSVMRITVRLPRWWARKSNHSAPSTSTGRCRPR